MSNDTGEPVDAKCPRCGASGAMKGIKVRTWFTIFFLPIFPLGRGRRMTQCGKCGASFSMPPEQFVGAAARADAKQMQRAITMYNSLRASPANSITLNDLMQLYASMAEFSQATSAAAEFPQALNSSEQCMTTLARVYLAMDEHSTALQWLDAALARNPDQGEALYYTAIAHLRGQPLDPQKAVTFARAAKKAEYPGAEELLAEAEAATAA
jgi:tetratricopeptide (TPR) repeat protein